MSIIRIGCTQFLRAKHELCALKMESCLPTLTTRAEDGTVRAIGIKVLGKCDAQYHVQVVWRNDGFPELCPLRHLLAWIAMSGISTGHIFRTNVAIDAPVPYTTFNTTYVIF